MRAEPLSDISANAVTPHVSSIRAALDGIISSPEFSRAERPARFLRHLVEGALNGKSDRLKESLLGVEVFGRPASWDPRLDAVVRQEAARLRKRLSKYYEQSGAEVALRIRIPVGTYVPVFERDSEPATESGPLPGIPEPAPKPNVQERSGWLIAATGFSVGLAISAMFIAGTHVSTGRPGSRGIVPDSSDRASSLNLKVRSDAEDLYLKGMYSWNKRTPDALSKAVDYFTQAMVRQPGYVQAYVGLADCYNLLSEYSTMPAHEAFVRAHAAAQKALELDDSSAEAHNAAAFSAFWGMWDVAAADREFHRALALNPGYVQAHHWYATYLLVLGRFSESLSQIERARELDPLSTPILADKGLILFYAGHQDEAVALLKQLESTDEEFLSSHRYLANIALVNNDYPTYVFEARETARLSHDPAALAVAEAARKGLKSGGRHAMLESILRVQKQLYARGAVQAYSLAQTSALLGEKQAALDYLQLAFQQRDIGTLAAGIDPQLRCLHDDPHYSHVVKKIGLAALN